MLKLTPMEKLEDEITELGFTVREKTLRLIN